MTRSFRKKGGSILIVTIWIVALLSLFALSVTTHVRLAVRQERWAQDETFARQMLTTLAKRAVKQSRSDEQPAFDALNEPWAAPFNADSNSLIQEFEGLSPAQRPFTASLSVEDEAGKININLASEDLLIEAIRETDAAGNAASLARAIIDWRDPDSDGAAEGDMLNQERTYVPANEDFTHIEELSFVRDVTATVLSGEDFNDDGVLDPNEDDGDVLPPQDNHDGLLQVGLRDLFTVYGNGEINVNGASEAVLEAVFRSTMAPPDATALARKIVEQRRGPDEQEGTEDDRPIPSVDKLREAVGPVYSDAVRHGISLAVESQAFRYKLSVTLPDIHFTRGAEFVVVRNDDRVTAAEWRSL